MKKVLALVLLVAASAWAQLQPPLTPRPPQQPFQTETMTLNNLTLRVGPLGADAPNCGTVASPCATKTYAYATVPQRPRHQVTVLSLAGDVSVCPVVDRGLEFESGSLVFQQADGGVACPGVYATATGAPSSHQWQQSVLSVTPQQYGAKGDGVTDDSVAIGNACAAIQAAGGGALHFPPGSYLVNTVVQPPPNYAVCQFTGIGPIRIDAQQATMMLPAVDYNNALYNLFWFSGCHDVSVTGFTSGGGIVNQNHAPQGMTLVRWVNGSTGLDMPFNRLSGTWTGLAGQQPDSDPASNHATEIHIGYLEVNGGTYGVNFGFSGDHMVIDYLKTVNVYRTLFIYGIHDVWANLDSVDPAGSHDVPMACLDGWPLDNIHLKYHRHDTGNGITSGGFGVSVEPQYDILEPDAGVLAPGAQACRNIDVDFDAVLPPVFADGGGNTVGPVFEFGKEYRAFNPTQYDTNPRGHEIQNLHIHGRIDMGGRRQNIISADPDGSWLTSENIRNLDIGPITVVNGPAPAAGNWFPIVFNVAQAVKDIAHVHDISISGIGEMEFLQSYPDAGAVMDFKNLVTSNTNKQGPGGSNALPTGWIIDPVTGNALLPTNAQSGVADSKSLTSHASSKSYHGTDSNAYLTIEGGAAFPVIRSSNDAGTGDVSIHIVPQGAGILIVESSIEATGFLEGGDDLLSGVNNCNYTQLQGGSTGQAITWRVQGCDGNRGIQILTGGDGGVTINSDPICTKAGLNASCQPAGHNPTTWSYGSTSATPASLAVGACEGVTFTISPSVGANAGPGMVMCPIASVSGLTCDFQGTTAGNQCTVQICNVGAPNPSTPASGTYSCAVFVP